MKAVAPILITLPIFAVPFLQPTPAATPATAANTVSTYCTPGTTTNGCLATMSYVGRPSVSTSGFMINVISVEGQKNGMIRYSLAPKSPATPWGIGTSFLCIKAPVQQTGIQTSGGTVGQCNGTLTLDWFLYCAGHPAALGQPQVVGSTFYAQAIFKDPPAPKTTSMSDAMMFVVGP